MSEIMRSGLQAVGRGQRMAARALGMGEGQVMAFVVLPQALRIIIPPIGNQFIGMLKLSALVSVIAVEDLLLVANQTASRNFRYLEALTAAGIYYLVLTTAFMLIQARIEGWAKGRRTDAKRRPTAAARRAGRCRGEGAVTPTSRRLLEATGVSKSSGRSRCCAACRSPSTAARRWSSSARPVPASRPSCAASTSWSRSMPAGSPSTAARDLGRDEGRRRRAARARHGVPEFRAVRPSERRPRTSCWRRRKCSAADGTRRGRRPSACSPRSTSRRRPTATRTSFRAGSSSASRSPGRSP